jgi:hypothetical protein
VSIDEATEMTVPVLVFSLVVSLSTILDNRLPFIYDAQEGAPLEMAQPASINNSSSIQQTTGRKALVSPSSVKPRIMGSGLGTSV